MRRKSLSFILILVLLINTSVLVRAASSDPIDIKSYQEFYNIIKNTILAVQESVTLRIYNYDSDTYDLSNVISQIGKDFPEVSYIYNGYQASWTSSGTTRNLSITFKYRNTQNYSSIITINSYVDLYNALKNSLQKFDDNLIVKINNYNSILYDFIKAIGQVYSDNPSFDFGFNKISYYSYGDGSNKIFSITLLYLYSKQVMEDMKQQAENKAEHIIAQIIKPGMYDYEIELLIHDYIVNHTSYDYDNYLNGTLDKEDYTVYGILINGSGVCEGYARTIKMLLDLKDIESFVVTGNGNGEGHAWNIVKIQGDYYQLDATWDDPMPRNGKNILSHDYFNITDTKMGVSHVWNLNSYPACNSSKYDYENIEALLTNPKPYPTATPLPLITPTPDNNTIKYIINENFDKMTTGSKPSSWTVIKTGGTVTVEKTDSGSNKSVKLNKKLKNGEVSFQKEFNAKAEKLTIGAKLGVGDISSSSRYFLIRDNNGKVAVKLVFDKNYIKVFNGGNKINLQKIISFNWYTIKLVLDNSKNKFDVYINSKLIKANLGYQNIVNGISNIKVQISSASKGMMFADNISVY